MVGKLRFVKGDTKILISALQEAVQDPDSDDGRVLDDGTSDVDTYDAFNYSIENWYKQLLKILNIG